MPDLSLRLTGLSLETRVDICIRYEFTEQLEDIVVTYGVRGIRQIDWGRGVMGGGSGGPSVLVCIGAYLLSQDKTDLVRGLATDCLASCGIDDGEGRKEAFVLASLLLTVDPVGGRRLIERAVDKPGSSAVDGLDDGGSGSSWCVGELTRDHLLKLA